MKAAVASVLFGAVLAIANVASAEEAYWKSGGSRSSFGVTSELGLRYLMRYNRSEQEGSPLDTIQGEMQTALWFRDLLGLYFVSGVRAAKSKSYVYGAGLKLRILTLYGDSPAVHGASLVCSSDYVYFSSYVGTKALPIYTERWLMRLGLAFEIAPFSRTFFINVGSNVFKVSDRLMIGPVISLGYHF